MRYFAAILFLTSTVVYAEHRPGLEWMRGLSGQGSCCGISDCAQVPVLVLGQTRGNSHVLVNGQEVVVPDRWVQPSQDAHTYWCYKSEPGSAEVMGADGYLRWPMPAKATTENTRCLFISPLG